MAHDAHINSKNISQVMLTTDSKIYEDQEIISVIQIHSGDGDGAAIVFDFSCRRISVSVFPSHCHGEGPEDFVEDHLIHLMGQTVDEHFADEYDDILDHMLYEIFAAGRQIFNEVARCREPKVHQRTLHSILFPEIFNFQLKTINDKIVVVPIDSRESYIEFSQPGDYGHDAFSDVKKDLPSFSSQEIHILDVLVRPASVTRVQVNGKEMLCKARTNGLFDRNLEQEICTLQKIKEGFSNAAEVVRVPKLLGYARNAESGAIIGFLREWISVGSLGGPLDSMKMSAIPRERREKWATQIRGTVDYLHELDLIWGDGKPGNIIIDAHDNAWLIDFGGGWTEGWVDEEVANSMKGDDQAVKNILLFLQVGE